MKPLLAILAGAALLVWPAFLNGYPLVFIDTVSYLAHTVVPAVPWDKTQAYGPFLHLFHWRSTLWLSLAAQGALVSQLLWLTQRAVRGGMQPLSHLLLCGALAALTSAPWFIATIMPDFFAGVVVLCLFLLGFAHARLSRREALWVGGVAALGIAAHLSLLPLAAALVLLVLVVQRRTAPVLRAAAPLALAALFLLGANWLAFGRVTLSAHGSVFLLARLQADGPAVRTLREHCPAAGWYLCDFVDRLPMDSDEFLWDPASPPARDAAGHDRFMGSMQLAPEAAAIVGRTLREQPLAVAQAMARNAVTQFFKVQVGDTLIDEYLDVSARWGIEHGFPARELAAFDAGLQRRGLLPEAAAAFLRPHRLILLLCVPLGLLGLWRAARDRDTARLGLLLCVLVGLAANAFATGALSKPHDRYQARIVWLLPLAAGLALSPRARRAPVAPRVVRNSRAAMP